jgi:CHAT domain-containing protein/tetratricopeptide (TPR) repeat protein
LTHMDLPQLVKVLLAAPGFDERIRILAESEFGHGAGLVNLLETLGMSVQADPDVAEMLAPLCVHQADSLGDHGSAAGARYHWARHYAARGDPDRALGLINEAQSLYTDHGHELSAIRTNLGRMHILDDFGRHRDAIGVGEQALLQLEHHMTTALCSQDHDLVNWVRAAIHENMGVAFGFTGAHERALQSYRTAETTYSELGLASDLARVQANRGIELIEVGRPAEGLDALSNSATQFATDNDRLWHGKCLGHQAKACLMLGRYDEALVLAEDARVHLEEFGAQGESARLLAALAEIALSLSLTDEALKLAVQAVSTFRVLGMTHDVATALNLAGIASAQGGAHQDALVYFEEAELHFLGTGAAASAAECSLAVASLLQRGGQRSEALARTMAATSVLTSSDSPARLAAGLLQLSDLSEGAERRRYLAEAASILTDSALPSLSWHLHLRLGRAHRASGDQLQAAFHLETAVEIIGQLQGTVPDDALRAMFLGDKRDAIAELAELLLGDSPPKTRRAFDVLDRARSRTLTGLGGRRIESDERRPRSDFSTPDTSVAQELDQAYDALLLASSDGEHDTVRTAKANAADLERDLTLLHLRGTRAGGTPGPLQAAIDTELCFDDPIVVYEMLHDDLHAFVLHGDQITHRELTVSRESLGESVADLARQRSQCAIGPDFVRRNHRALLRTSRETTHQLYQHLVAPILDLLELDSTKPRVTIVPTGVLQHVPFHALFDGTKSLGSRCTLALAPSAAFAARERCSEAMPRETKHPLILGVSDASIPGAAREARHVSSVLPGARVFVGAEATTARLHEFGQSADVIHLACHGLHRAESPLFSALRLADGWLTAREIINMSFDGATVVLSACESGLHAVGDTEPLGLSWAFLAAGAAAVVVSLWSVQDDITSDFMSVFYRRLKAGLDTASALRSAQQHIAARHPHPYYWAPFAVVGSPPRPAHWRQP